MKTNIFKYMKNDIPASIVVFFVALPLCLGIALASGAPPFAGMIAGIIGGIVVGSFSGSQIGVSGPAAGLAAIVMSAIGTLGGYENFLVAVVIGGVIQIVFGIIKAGVIGYYFPNSVIKGMLVGIGIIIIFKQIPHFFGYDSSGSNGSFLTNINTGATLIGILSLVLMLVWSTVLAKKSKIFTLIQGPFAAVILGIIYYVTTKESDTFSISSNLLVRVPIPESFDSFLGQFTTPNFSVIGNSDVWVTGFTIALVASLETLLCVEATDKIDPRKRITPTNRELLAQGTGNILSGMIGGLPITQVIVRSSANIQSGGQTKLSAIVHGFLLLISVITIPTLLNKIPLAVLAAILLIVGYKLANPATFKKMFSLGWKQYIPFLITVALVYYNLLIGIGVGLLIGIAIVPFRSFTKSCFSKNNNDQNSNEVKIEFSKEITFFHKARIMKRLDRIPNDSSLEFDLSKIEFLDFDVIEMLEDFREKAKQKGIQIRLISKQGTYENPENLISLLNIQS